MNRLNAEDLIRLRDLQPHPEGGYFRETYKAEEWIAPEALPGRFDGRRRFCTAIYYLLPRGARSCLHRLKADEVWHFYLGDPLDLFQVQPDGSLLQTVLGSDLRAGQKVQHVVPAGTWFGARPAAGSEYGLVGCTVAPGFEFADFEMPPASLFDDRPQLREQLKELL